MHSESNRRAPFLTAEWRHLLMLNYPVERELLEPFVPAGTTLDTYKGRAYVSLVGFLFLKTRLLGVAVPWHQDFEEVNLRFYVRRFAGDDWRRGVVFIKEIVPKAAIALVARLVYNENYVSLPMRHQVPSGASESTDQPSAIEYGWDFKGQWHNLRAEVSGEPAPVAPGSLEEFITEHYWGYAAQRDGGCVEYQVEHPRWRVWPAHSAAFEGNVAALYGEAFVSALSGAPASAFVAEGSAVTVFKGQRIQG